jgi:ABC-type transport system involved in multi-copper enzyme maturation permease subunit
MKHPFDPALLKAIFLIYLELALLVAVAILFSTFTSSILAALFAGFVYVTGYFSSDLKNLEGVVDSAFLPQLTRVLYYVLPNFKNFDVKAAVVAGDPVPLSQLSWATAYAAIYVALLLVASCWIFRQRNLK